MHHWCLDALCTRACAKNVLPKAASVTKKLNCYHTLIWSVAKMLYIFCMCGLLCSFFSDSSVLPVLRKMKSKPPMSKGKKEGKSPSKVRLSHLSSLINSLTSGLAYFRMSRKASKCYGTECCQG